MRFVYGDKSYPSFSVLLRIIIPGWPLILVGHRTRGVLLLAAFLGFLVPSLLLWGSDAGTALLVLALAVHAASVLNIVGLGTIDLQTRAVCALVCAGLLGLVLYLPLLWIVTRLVIPHWR